MRSRTRLTITLAPDLLDEIDRRIDGRAVRNRSHAIELLLRDSLSPTITTAVLLAGGPSSAVDESLPALKSVQGQALIVVTLNHLIAHGVRSFVILAGGNELALRRLLGDGMYRGANLRYVSEKQPLGTAGALKAAEPFLAAGPFLVLHADVLTDINVVDFMRFHARQNGLATMAVKPRRAEPSYGKVLLEGNKITEFIANDNKDGISIVNTGIYAFQPDILHLIEISKPTSLETDVFPTLAKLRELSAFLFQGIWFDISRPEDYESAKIRWQQKGASHHA